MKGTHGTATGSPPVLRSRPLGLEPRDRGAELRLIHYTSVYKFVVRTPRIAIYCTSLAPFARRPVEFVARA